MYGGFRKARALARLALDSCLIGAALLAAAAVTFTIIGPRVFGLDVLTMQGGSMEPAIDRGSLVIVRQVAPRQLATGDVLVFSSSLSPGVVVTHRVVEVERQAGSLAFRTKGDANDAPDPSPVPAAQVRGKVVVHIPWVGSASAFVGTPFGFLLLLALPAAVLAWGEVREIASVLKAMRGKSAQKGRTGSPATEEDSS